MTPEVRQTHNNIADTLRELSGPGVAIPDLSSTIRRVESVNTVKFIFHPWIPIENLGPDGFAFNVHYARLERLKLIPIPVFDYARVINQSHGFSLMSAIVGDIGAIPSRGQNRIETLMQMPTTSIEALRIAHGKRGLVELESLIANDEQDLRYSFGLFNSLFREADGEADLDRGQRPEGLLLENFPGWLDHDAPRLVETLAKEIAGFDTERAFKLLSEIRHSIALAEEAALSPSIGILPRTKEGLNITANRGTGGKTHLDAVDEWLLKQYPSFEMDTDVERARLAMQTAIEAGNAGQQTVTKLLADVLERQERTASQQQQTLDLLVQHMIGAKAKPTSKTATE
jgi:hypothetical protein